MALHSVSRCELLPRIYALLARLFVGAACGRSCVCRTSRRTSYCCWALALHSVLFSFFFEMCRRVSYETRNLPTQSEKKRTRLVRVAWCTGVASRPSAAHIGGDCRASAMKTAAVRLIFAIAAARTWVELGLDGGSGGGGGSKCGESGGNG